MKSKETDFKFEHCANYYDGCDHPPYIKYESKELCLQCYSKLIYKDLEFAIKYGKHKNFYKKLERLSVLRSGGAFGKRKC